MAKSSKDRDRRAIVEEMRKKQQAQERRRTLLVLLACLLVGGLIIGFAAVKYLDQRRKENRDLSEIGVARSAASCQDEVTKPYDGPKNNHVASGTKVDYPDAPPAFGQHDGNFLTGSEIKNFYHQADRPPVERMVHELEHGYTLLWYDDTIADDEAAMEDLDAVAARFPVGDRLMITPWTEADGAAFPDGAHIALTHWTGPEDQKGVWEYCGKISGEVIDDYTKKYTPENAPEPGAT